MRDSPVVKIEVHGSKEMLEEAYKLGASSQDLSELTYKLAVPIAQRAKQLAPKGDTQKLSEAIKPYKSRLRIKVAVGNKRTMPYAAVNHWGWDGKTGPKWLRKAEEQLRTSSMDGLEQGIADLLSKHNF